MRLRMPVEAVYVSKPIHNGSVSRDSLSLRKREIGGARSWQEVGNAATVT